MINLAGHDIGRYHITESLGEGSMAVVYKALDTHLERDVAVKVIRSDQIPPAQLTNMLARFEREAKALARLEHANIIRIFDYGEYQGAPYLVMNYLPGGALKKYMGRPLAYRSAARFLLPMARALEYAHQQGVVHGGVKPANILLTQQKAPILSDFGIVRILENEGGTLTGTGVGVGTPGYMAPEQWSGKIDPAVDIYALGVVLYELITGRMPYQANTPMEIFSKQLTEPLPQPSRFITGLPSEMDQIITRALDVKPAGRYGSMSEMIGKLEQMQSPGMPATAAPKVQAEILAQQAKPEENQLTVTLDEGISFDFVRIPAGSFFMGEDDPLKSQYNRPSCQIFLNEFWMGKYPITNAQYRMFTREVNDKKPIGGFPADKEDHPVININSIVVF